MTPKEQAMSARDHDTAQTIEGVIGAVQRFPRLSGDGNPRYQVTLSDGRSFPTVTNGSVGYVADNYGEGATDYGVRVRLSVNGKGELLRIEPLEAR